MAPWGREWGQGGCRPQDHRLRSGHRQWPFRRSGCPARRGPGPLL